LKITSHLGGKYDNPAKMRADDSDILLALYRSAPETPAWQGFLRALAARCGARLAHVVVQREGEVKQVFGNGALPLDAEALARMRYLRPYSGDDMAAKQPFRALRTRAEGGGDAWIIVARQGDDFAAATSSLLSSLAPHLALAAGQFWRHQQTQARHAVEHETGARLGLAWVLLAASGAVILTNAAPPAGFLLGDKLRLPAPLLRQITQRIGGYVTAQNTAPLALQLMQSQAVLMPFSGHGAAAILYVQNAKPAPTAAPHVLADLFGLTPNEARFAAELAQGRSIAQAGAALNFTLETARYYSKQLYAKLDASGQADVVLRIKNSIYNIL
jgi:DNA-binding CsgD family transcriptional regulator